MSRLKYPTTIEGQTTLLANIKARVLKDGASGPLVAMLASKGIDLDNDIATGVDALASNTLFLAETKAGQLLCQNRNMLMKPIMRHLRGSFQFLKKLVAPNFKALGDWGATVSDSSKITYPKDTAGRVELFMLMKEKNDGYPTMTSPLLPYLTKNNISLAIDAANGADAVIDNDNFKKALKNAETARELRDRDWKIPLSNQHTIGSFLKKFYSGNTKALGYYGFVVVEAPKAIKIRTLRIAFGSFRLNKRVAVGDTLNNLGDTDLNIYKGKTIAGEPILLRAGEKMIVPKKYSTLSIMNVSSVISGMIMLIPRKKASKK